MDDDEIRKWRKFFVGIGVDKILESEKEGGKLSKIVERIAILTALQYEKKNERLAKELGESIKPGYDIESEEKNTKRYIEVKGTKEASDEIFLTVNELNTLRDNSENYFVYVVTSALKNPHLHVTIGEKLIDIQDIKIIIPSKKWLSEAKVDEFQP